MGLCAVSDLVIAESGTRFGFTETRLGILPAVIAPFVIAKIGESHARALFPGGRRFDATRASGSAWSTRSWRARRRSMQRSTRRSPTSWRPARPPPGRPRRSSARSADCPMARRSGTPPGSSPGSAGPRRPRRGFAAFSERRPPAGSAGARAGRTDGTQPRSRAETSAPSRLAHNGRQTRQSRHGRSLGAEPERGRPRARHLGADGAALDRAGQAARPARRWSLACRVWRT